MRKITLLLCLGLFLMTQLSNQQSILTKENDLIRVTGFGDNKNIISLILDLEDKIYVTSVQGEIMDVIASYYYGWNTFSSLVFAANPTLGEHVPLPIGTQIRLPSVLFCVHFMSIDCIKESFDNIQESPTQGLEISGQTLNFWSQLPANINSKLQTSTFLYPNYIYFVMGYLNSLPETSLRIQIVNNLYFDLTEGKVTYIYGSGVRPSDQIRSLSKTFYDIEKTDILHGFQGKLSFKLADFKTDLGRISFDFNIFPGNSTTKSTVSYVKLECSKNSFSGFQYQDSIPRKYNVLPEIEVTLTISKNPMPYIKIILNPRFNLAKNFTMASKNYLISPHHLGIYLEGLSDPLQALQGNQRLGEENQNWRIIPADLESRKNQFRIINSQSKTALEENIHISNITASSPNATNITQIWNLVPIAFSTFMIKSSQNSLCWHYDVDRRMRNSSNSYSRTIYLEPCNFNFAEQKFYITEAYIPPASTSNGAYKITYSAAGKTWSVDQFKQLEPYIYENSQSVDQDFLIRMVPGYGYEIRKFDLTKTDSCWTVSSTIPKKLVGTPCSNTNGRYWYLSRLGNGVTITHTDSKFSLKRSLNPTLEGDITVGELIGDEATESWQIALK